MAPKRGRNCYVTPAFSANSKKGGETWPTLGQGKKASRGGPEGRSLTQKKSRSLRTALGCRLTMHESFFVCPHLRFVGSFVLRVLGLEEGVMFGGKALG